MPFDSVQPLRISKNNTPSSSPSKMAPASRALSEISASSMRRNSPSYNQATKKMIVSREASPYTENSFTKPSIHDFWSSKDPLSSTNPDVENSFSESFRSPSPSLDSSPRRRPSVEKLQQASRVKNSKIFELENKVAYDPLSMPVVERPAANRPLSQNFANNSFARADSLRKENSPLRSSPHKLGHRRADSEINIPKMSPYQVSSPISASPSRAASSPSPTKSSLARSSQFGLHNTAFEDSLTWSDEDRCSTPRATLHRNNKSVTFGIEDTINEYEKETPEPSIAAESVCYREVSYDRDVSLEDGDRFDSQSSLDNSFDADLENIEKTPVMTPEHYAHMSKEEARRNLIDDEDDVFESSVIHNPLNEALRRSVSVTSDGSNRPLPPLPNSLRKKESRRVLVEHEETEELVITNLDTGESKELHVSVREATVQDESIVAELEEFAQSPPRISRESILRKVRGSKYDFNDEDDEDETFADATENAHLSIAELAQFNPDQPIPSTEVESDFGLLPSSPLRDVEVKVEREDSTIDLSTVTPIKSAPNHFKPQTLVSAAADDVSDDGEVSRYSPTESETAILNSQPVADLPELGEPLHDAMSLLTVKDYSKGHEAKSSSGRKSFGLPEYSTLNDWTLAMETFGESSPFIDEPVTVEPTQVVNAFTPPIVLAPQAQVVSERSSTPDSVLRRISDPVSETLDQELQPAEHQHDDEYDGTHRPVSPIIPERRATIRTGGKLKTRPSGTPADFEAMLNDVGDVDLNPMPALPGQWTEDNHSKHDLSLDVPDLAQNAPTVDNDMLGLDREFDRLIEGQKRGYLTRQNTKVVVASERNFSGESGDTIDANAGAAKSDPRALPKTSARLPSAEQHIRAEPWNGKQRRKSMRTASAQRVRDEAAPPLPGQQSALGMVTEDRSLLDDTDLGDTERGRLFIKVVGISDLDMPLPRNDRLDFKLTLDNGLHCVTTGALELDHNAAIGQEFELVVQNDLDFQLTLSTRLPPATKAADPVSMAPPSPTKSTKSALSRFLSSPKKRAEKERQEREAQELEERRRQEEAARKRASVQPNVFDLMRELVSGTSGYFARAYVNLATYESECYGRKAEVSVPLYNEWALEKDDVMVNSIRSKRGANCGPIRRPPYIIGQLICQLLYVPRPKAAEEEDLPKSMSAAVRDINKASEAKEISHEGFLSQQGGDCVHWRRRFFNITGSKLTAYHEHTHQKRAVINLAKASRLVDDRTTLVADPLVGKTKSKSGRRKSAFAEEDEGYQYVEEGFRIRFANGETIDFYADSRAEKDAWMDVLAEVIGRPDAGASKQTWTDLVLAREKAQGRTPKTQSMPATPSFAEVRDFAASQPANAPPVVPAKEVVVERKPALPAKSAPTSPVKKSYAAPATASPAKRPTTPPMQPRTGHRKRQAVKSMIF